MLFLRVLAGLAAAALVGFLFGMVKEDFNLFPDQDYAHVWPIACAASAFAGALLMALLKPSRFVSAGGAARPPQATRAPQPAKPQAASAGSRPASPTAAPAAQPLPPGMETSSEVPGMPTFDFDQARAGGPDQKPSGAKDKA
jgi:hypothetical protein